MPRLPRETVSSYTYIASHPLPLLRHHLSATLSPSPPLLLSIRIIPSLFFVASGLTRRVYSAIAATVALGPNSLPMRLAVLNCGGS